MAKIFYATVITAILLWILFVNLLLSRAPDTNLLKLYGLTLFFMSMTTTITSAMYLYKTVFGKIKTNDKKVPEGKHVPRNKTKDLDKALSEKSIYMETIKKAALISFILAMLLLVRVFTNT